MEDEVKRWTEQELIWEVRNFWCKEYRKDFLCDLADVSHRASDEDILSGLKKLL